jgi:hypothetical protein
VNQLRRQREERRELCSIHRKIQYDVMGGCKYRSDVDKNCVN